MGSNTNTQELTFVNYINFQIAQVRSYGSGAYQSDEDCMVMREFIVDRTAESGYGISWSKGNRNANGSCSVDTSASAKKYLQKTPIIFETVKGQKIMRTIAGDIYKVAKDEYMGIEILWAIATNSAGVKDIYRGEIERADVKRIYESGNRQAIGNRAFVETINKAWGYSELPSESVLFTTP
jgi:hypothetical protein